MAKITKQYLDFNGLNLYNEYVFSKIKQPDWNQNDETAADYVKNRTHYIQDNGTVIQLDEKFIPDTIARVSTDNEILAELIEADLLSAVTTNNKILTDNNGRIILRY